MTTDRNSVKMKAVVIFLGLVALSQAASYSTWELFKAIHEKLYATEAEESLRKAIFQKNVARIEAHNLKYEAGEETFKQGINQFTDMLKEEVTSTMNGYRSSKKVKSDQVFVGIGNSSLPDTVDWRTEGIVTRVKNQLNCGSCWSFSATGSTEGQWALSTGNLVSLSEQQLVSCANVRNGYQNLGCNGGNADWAFAYMIDVGGLESEADYPYTSGEGVTGTCEFDASKIVASITTYVDLQKFSESALQEAAATIGPISVAIDASHNSFHSYTTGVYYEPDCSFLSLDHAVLVVGYGTEDGEDYWLVKNSWGYLWGELGYIKMSRNRNNNCGIATEPSYPVV